MDASGLDRTLLVEVGLRLHFGPLAGTSWVSVGGGRGYPFLRGVVWIPRDVVSASVGTLA